MVVDNELSVHFDVDKINSVLFGTEFSKKTYTEIRNSVCNGVKMKLCIKVKYLGCVLDKNLPGDLLVLNVIYKVIQ